MKSILFSFYCFFIFIKPVGAQNKNEEIYNLIKIWGVLKYYHPEIQKGKIDWDAAFLLQVNKLLKDNAGFSAGMGEMLETTGRPEIKKRNKSLFEKYSKTPYNNLSFDWLFKDLLTIATTDRDYLQGMVVNYIPRKNKYIKNEVNKYYVHTPLKEFYYPSPGIPDKASGLLALARYWNVINYLDPHKHNLSESWDSTLMRFIPQILNTAGTKEIFLTYASLTTRINDSHSFYLNYEFDSLMGKRLPAMLVNVFDNKYLKVVKVSDTLSKITGLKVGVTIEKINGVDVNERRLKMQNYWGASNTGRLNFLIAGNILRGNLGQNYSIDYVDKNAQRHTAHFMLTQELALQAKDKIIVKPVKNFQEQKTMYIPLSGMTVKSFNKAINLAQANADCMVLDFRDFGETHVKLNNLLRKFKNSRVEMATYYTCSMQFPGYFKKSKMFRRGFFSFLYKKYKKNVIVLADESDLSYREFDIMALKAAIPGLTIIGRNTAGADGAAASVLLQDNVLAYFTRDVIEFPDGTKTQGIGIRPDIYVTEDIEMVKAGKDALLEAALNYIKRK